MEKYLLAYNYAGEKEKFTLESTSASYLKHKVSEASSFAEEDIQYTIYKIEEEGIVKYSDID